MPDLVELIQQEQAKAGRLVSGFGFTGTTGQQQIELSPEEIAALYGIQGPPPDAKWQSVLCPSQMHSCDWQAGARVFKPPKDASVVEMYPERQKQASGVYLAGEAPGRFRPDAAVLLAIGPDVPERENLQPGCHVLVHPKAGKWVENARMGTYTAREQVRFYGPWRLSWGDVPRWSKYGECLLAHWDENAMAIKGMISNRILIRRTSKAETAGGIILQEGSRHRSQLDAEAVQVGPRVTQVKPGEKLVYRASAALELEFSADPDLAIITEDDVYAVCDPDG